MAARDSYSFQPLTADRWADFAELFGPRGACAGCWCMWWQLTRKQFEAGKGEGNRRAIKARVEAGEVPGLLAYSGGEAVGWCALEPRSAYPRLARSRILKPVDEAPVYSVVCFFVHRDHRRRGLTLELLEAAARFAAERGAELLEGYPVEPKDEKVSPLFLYHGIAETFRRAGFEEVARRSPTRPIMRRRLGPAPAEKGGGAAGG